MKKCANIYQKCENEITNPRKKFCCDSCKYWFNSIRKEKESHLPPVKKRTKDYFSMVVGSERCAGRGQGKRSNGTIKGSMSDFYIRVTVEEIVEVNKENVIKHFQGIPGHMPTYVLLGDQTRLTKEEIYSQLGI